MEKLFSSYWIRSAFYSIMQRFSLTIFGLANFMILVRTLTPSQMGTWALFLSVISVFEATKSGLLKNAHIRFVSATSDKAEKIQIASSSFLINLGITILFTGFLLICSNWLSEKLHAGLYLSTMLHYFIPGMFCMVFFSHFEAIQQSHLDFKGVFAGYLARQFSFFCFIVYHKICGNELTVTSLTIYQSISLFIGAGTLYFFSKKYMYNKFEATKNWLKKILEYGSYIFGSNIMVNLFSNLDQIMTASFIPINSTAYVAQYNTAAKINGIVDIPSYAAADIIFPKSARASVEGGKEKVKYLYERMVGILLSFTTPVALLIIIFPKFSIDIIAGKKYEQAALILQLYMLTGLLRPMQNQAANILNSIGKSRLCFIVDTIGLAINLVANYICLTYFGFYGAAMGTLITCVIGFFTWYIIMKREINIHIGTIFHYAAETYKIIYSFSLNYFKTRKLTDT